MLQAIMTGEGPPGKNRPSPFLCETFTNLMRDLHQIIASPSLQHFVSTLTAPNGPSDGPIEAFSASFAPNDPSLGPLRAFMLYATSFYHPKV